MHKGWTKQIWSIVVTYFLVTKGGVIRGLDRKAQDTAIRIILLEKWKVCGTYIFG